VNLVGAQPRNEAARQEGMYRVFPRNPDKSLLFHKLQWNPDHHSGRTFGNPMPLGGESLSIGEIEFVRLWIAAGAPYEGFVADSTLLLDTRKPNTEPFRPLPLPGSGYQLRIDSFSVAPNYEREIFVYRRVGNAQDVFVNRVETRTRVNSHHLLVMKFKDNTPANMIPGYDVVRDIRSPEGNLIFQNMLVMEWHNFFAGSGQTYEDRQLPPGIALRLPAQASLDLNVHYVNRGPTPIPGEVYINLHTVPASQVQREAQSFTFQHDTFELPPNQRTTITRTFTFTRDVNILMLTSHNHELGERFVIRIAGGPRNGEIVYTSTDWKHPTVSWFEQPVVLRAGEGLTSEVTYNNTTARAIRHGANSTDEMNIMRGYWY
jgi:hypothetical protein